MSVVLSDVWVDRWSLKSLVASAVEVYPRETMGLLWGVRSQRELEERKRRILSIKSVYPVQTARRKLSNVDWGNEAAKRRLLNVLQIMGVGIVGEFHSHPKAGTLAQPSSDDLHYYLRESVAGRDITSRDWIEMVIRIRDYVGGPSYAEPVYGKYNYRRAERFHIAVQDKVYDITLSAWVIELEEGKVVPNQGTVWIEWPVR